MYTRHTHVLTCSQIHICTHTLHTCYSCKWYFLSSLICAFSSAIICCKKTISCLRFSANRGLGGNVLLEEKSDSRATYSAGIMHLRRGYEAADYGCKMLQKFNSNTLHVMHILVRGSGGIPLLGKYLEFWISESVSACYLQLP